MASDRNSSLSANSAEQAMNRVLEAERNAEKAITDCEHEAHDILQAAQQRAQRIADRTNKRITLLHQRCSQRIDQDINALKRAAGEVQYEKAKGQLSESHLTLAVDEVADHLTSSTEPSSNKGDLTE